MRGKRQRLSTYKHRQKGAVAIEFAFVFPVFFLIFYAIVFYSLAFLVTQNFTLASEEILRSAMAIGEDFCEDLELAPCPCEAYEKGTEDEIECRINWAKDNLTTGNSSLLAFNTGNLQFFGAQGAAPPDYCQAEAIGFVCYMEISGSSLLPGLDWLNFETVFPDTLSGKSSLLL